MVDERIGRLQKQYETITLERSAAQRTPLIRIVTGFVSTGLSLLSLLVPIPGVADKLTDKLGERVAHKMVDNKYPHLAWMYVFQEYRRIYEDSLLKRRRISLKINELGKPSEVEFREVDFCATLGIERFTLYHWLDDGWLPLPNRSWEGLEVYTTEHLKIGKTLVQRRSG